MLLIMLILFTQFPDAAMRDRVLQLVEKLEAPKVEARKAAEEALLKLGPRVLPLLPEARSVQGDDRRQRLERVRGELQAALDTLKPEASKVTLKGKGIRLSEALERLQKQSGNAISDLREATGAETTNPALDIEIVDQPFFAALDMVLKQAQVTANYYTGDGTIGLMAGAPADTRWVQYVGPFRVAIKQVAVVRDFQTDSGSANVQLDVAWEPRFRPMLLSLDGDELVVKDDRGREVKPQVRNESSEVVLRPENPAAEINVNLDAPDRSARALSELKVKAEVTIPAGVRTFRFPNLAARDVVQKLHDVSVTLESTEVDEQVWKVNVVLEYPGGGPAFESYRQGLFNNRIWLQKADGARFEHNGGFSNTASDQGRLGFEYLFVDAPGKPADYQLVYETPSRVETLPLEFTFKDVPLP